MLQAPTAVRGTHRVRLQWQGVTAGQTVSVWLADDGTQAFQSIATGLSGNAGEVDLGPTWKLDWPTARLRVRACSTTAVCSDSNAQPLVDALQDGVAVLHPQEQRLASIFGIRVALSTDGNTLAVADPLDHPSTGPRPPGIGSVTIFRRCGNGCWRREAYVTNFEVPGNFGGKMALSGDGGTLVVGAYDNGVDGWFGAVFVYVREGNQVWRQQAVLRAAEPRATDNLGYQVAIDASGDHIIASGDKRLLAFARDSSGTWRPDGVVEEPALVADLSPRTALAISGDGRLIVSSARVGVPPGYPYEAQASVRVYARGAPGIWVLQADLRSGKPPPTWMPYDPRPDHFGQALSLDHAGTTLAAGASLDNGDASDTTADPGNYGAAQSGAVYIFGRTGVLWQRRAFVKARTAPQGDEFGTEVALSSDGRVLLAKACGRAGNVAGVQRSHRAGTENIHYPDSPVTYCDAGGSGYVLTQDDAGRWSHTASIIPVGDEFVAFTFFSIALSGDAGTIALGASSYRREDNTNQDRVFVY